MLMLKMLVWAAALGFAVWFYMDKVRPWLHEQPWLSPYYTKADTFWQDLGVKVKEWWGTALTVAALVGAEIPGLLVNLADIDFTVLGLRAETAKVIAQMIAVGGLIVRFAVHKKPQE